MPNEDSVSLAFVTSKQTTYAGNWQDDNNKNIQLILVESSL